MRYVLIKYLLNARVYGSTHDSVFLEYDTFLQSEGRMT